MWDGKGIGNVRILNTYAEGYSPFGSEKIMLQQDQLYLIPVPAALLLGVVGVGLIGVAKRRFE